MRGFTLIETLMALGLAGLVVSLGVLIYRTFVGMHHRHETRINWTYDASLVQDRLRKDAAGAFRYVQEYEEVVLLDRKDNELVRYVLADSVLIRKTPLQTDSLYFSGSWLRGNENDFGLHDARLNLDYSFRLPSQGKVRKSYVYPP